MPVLSDPQTSLDVSNIVYVASAFLAVVATLCIVIFGNRVGRAKDNELKTYQAQADARIAEANARAAEANIRVAEANATAAQANATAGNANQRAGEANALAQQAQLDKAKIEHDNLILQEQLNKERDARLAIEKRLAQRGLTLAEIGPVKQATYPLGLQPIDIVYYKDDAEARMLANNLAITFEAWTVVLYEAPGGAMHQVDVEYDPNDEKAAERAKAIFEALRRTNKLRMGGPFSSLPHDIPGTTSGYYPVPPAATIRISIGYR